MGSVVVTAEKLIKRPLDVVQAQFVDLRHHREKGVHAAISFGEIQQNGEVSHVTARRKILGRVHEDHLQVTRFPDGNSEFRSLSGANAGLTIQQRFEAVGPGETRVLLRIELPTPGLKRLLAPLIRGLLARDTAHALEEDRRDLEEGGYSVAG